MVEHVSVCWMFFGWSEAFWLVGQFSVKWMSWLDIDMLSIRHCVISLRCKGQATVYNDTLYLSLLFVKVQKNGLLALFNHYLICRVQNLKYFFTCIRINIALQHTGRWGCNFITPIVCGGKECHYSNANSF